MAEKSFIDTAIPIVLVIIAAGFFWVKLKLGKHMTKLIEWIKENTKSKKQSEENPNTYSYVDYD